MTDTKNEKLELRAKLYAWQQSLHKGVSLCRRHTHEGDASTLEDIIKYLEEIREQIINSTNDK